MYRDFVKGNKICYRFNEERNYQFHEKRVYLANSKVDNNIPVSCDLNIPYHNKKMQQMEDKYTEIERENRILLEKITNIMSKPVTEKERSKSLNTTGKKTLNSEKRKKQLIKITLENQQILNRIKNRKSIYDTRKILKDTQKHIEIGQRIQEFGGNKQKKFESSKMQGRQRSGEFKQVNQSFNGQEYSPKKLVLFKQKVEYESDQYYVEMFIKNGVFKITADNIQQPITKILEMSQRDGQRVLRNVFNNDINLLASNLLIDNKIHIKGLEQFEEQEDNE